MAEKKKAKPAKKTTRKKPPKKAEVKKEEAMMPSAGAVEVQAPAVPAPQAPPAEKVARKPKKEMPAGPKYYGTGRRKEATAKVWLTPGSGKILLNGRSVADYFCGRKLLEFLALRPLAATNTQSSYDVHAEVFGGGVPGQAGAVCMGISRALLAVSPDFKVKLKREGLLTRDPRMKERKKYGLKRARRAFQFTKR
jgi:small subunit ribosomal protein S9